MTSEGKKYVSIKKKDFTSPFPASMQTYGVMQPNINYLNGANLKSIVHNINSLL